MRAQLPQYYYSFLMDRVYTSYNDTTLNVIQKLAEDHASTYRPSDYIFIYDFPDESVIDAYGVEIPLYIYNRLVNVFEYSYDIFRRMFNGLAGKTVLSNVPAFSNYAHDVSSMNIKTVIFDILCERAFRYNGYCGTYIYYDDDDTTVYNVCHGTIFANGEPILLLCKKASRLGISTYAKVYLSKSAPQKFLDALMEYACIPNNNVDMCLVDTIPYISKRRIIINEYANIRDNMPLLKDYDITNND